MTRLTRLCRAVGVGLAVVAATLSMTQVANAKPAQPIDTSTITPTSGQVFLVGHAKGVQKYQCTTDPVDNVIKWKFVAPEADLVDDNGKLIVKHFAGPTWQSTADKSAVKGTLMASVPSPTPDRAIPWLLLSTSPADGSPTTGLLVGTKFIQRLETKGGTAPPAASCKAQTLNKVHEVPYKADYAFWK
jgi:hypothetical protein